MKKKVSTKKIITAMLLGGVLGLIFGERLSFLKVIGDIFLRLVQMSIILLVMGQVIEAVGSLNPKTLGKIGIKTISVFLISSLLAAAMGIFVGSVLQPGGNLNASMFSQSSLAENRGIGSVSETILSFFPKNVIESMAQGSIVQVIVFSLLFGLALSYIAVETSSGSILGWVKEINQVILKLVSLVMKMAPVGILAIIASTIGKMGIDVILPLAKYLGSYGLATALFLIIWLVVASLYCGVSLIKLIKNLLPMSIMALATISSAVTLPTALKDSEERLGIGKRVSKLVLPLGMSLNSNGSAMHMAITIVTVAQISGIRYTVGEYLFIVVLSTLASLANAVVPGAGLVSLSIVIPQMGLPIESIALFAGVEWFVGMLRTVLNVDSDALSALVVAKSENELDLVKFNR